ncbi:MAG: FecR domain-containing protein [Gallionellaceae bacterium]|jgi:hypothetical protein
MKNLCLLNFKKYFLLMPVLFLLFGSAVEAAEVAGKIGYMSGTLVAKRADGSVKIMAPKSEVLEGDLLETGKNSFAQVILKDGMKMTVRPYSNLKIESYQFNKEAPKEDVAVFNLVKGGFRTVTGLIGKRGNSDAYKLKVATATIGVRGTDFSSRLCANENCDDEANAPATPLPVVAKPAILSVGRVMLVQGGITAKNAAGKVRKLVIGSPVYAGDLLMTNKGAHAVVAFRDSGRVTLEEDTEFHVEKFDYKQPDKQENASLKLLKGGVRVVTGIIGRVKHDNYQFKVATATIGVRGTGFDTWCKGDCPLPPPSAGNPPPPPSHAGSNPMGMGGGNTPAAPPPPPPAADPLNGAGVYVWAGAVVMSTPQGTQNVGTGQGAMLTAGMNRPAPIAVIPPSVLNNPAPKPDTVKVDDKTFENEPAPAPAAPALAPEKPTETEKPAAPEKPTENEKPLAQETPAAAETPATPETPAVSAESPQTPAPATPPAPVAEAPAEPAATPPGVYVTVHDGQVVMGQESGKTIDVSKGQTGFVSENVITQLPETPKFMLTDKPVDAPEETSSRSQTSGPSQSGCVVK